MPRDHNLDRMLFRGVNASGMQAAGGGSSEVEIPVFQERIIRPVQ